MNVAHRMIAASQQIAFQEQAVAGTQDTAREARFEALVHRQPRFVFGIVYALLRNPQDAEDAVQETFFKLYRSGAWEGMNDERAFLARAAWRIAATKLKTARVALPESAVLWRKTATPIK